jgi:hypothetical protein
MENRDKDRPDAFLDEGFQDERSSDVIMNYSNVVFTFERQLNRVAE